MLWKKSLELLHFEVAYLDSVAMDNGMEDPAQTLKRGNVAQIALFYWTERKRVRACLLRFFFFFFACQQFVCLFFENSTLWLSIRTCSGILLARM